MQHIDNYDIVICIKRRQSPDLGSDKLWVGPIYHLGTVENKDSLSASKAFDKAKNIWNLITSLKSFLSS